VCRDLRPLVPCLGGEKSTDIVYTLAHEESILTSLIERRRFNAEVPTFVQWDDHETLNNWYPSEQLSDDRYKVKSVAILSARARQAFLDYLPIHASSDGLSRIYRTILSVRFLKCSFWICVPIAGPTRRIVKRK